MAKVWSGDYWKAKKSSPWFMAVVVLAVLWAYGHVNGGAAKDAAHTGGKPSASASASPGHGHPEAGQHAK